MTDTLAPVIPIRASIETPPSPQARDLPFRQHATLPPTTAPISRLEYRIEQQLSDLWDMQLDPAWFLRCFSPAIAAVADPLLAAVFATSAAAAEAVMQGPSIHALDAAEAYQDAIYDLAQAVCGHAS